MVRFHRMTKKRLGELLVDEGLVTQERVQEALTEQKKTGELLGEALVRLGYVTERDIARAISTQFSIPFLSARKYDIPKEVMGLIPYESLEQYQLVPIDMFGNVLTVVLAGVPDANTIEKIETSTSCAVQIYVGTATDIKETLMNFAKELKIEQPDNKKSAKGAAKTPPEDPSAEPPAQEDSKESPLDELDLEKLGVSKTAPGSADDSGSDKKGNESTETPEGQ